MERTGIRRIRRIDSIYGATCHRRWLLVAEISLGMFPRTEWKVAGIEVR